MDSTLALVGGLARHGKQNRLGHMTEELQKKKFKRPKENKRQKPRASLDEPKSK